MFLKIRAALKAKLEHLTEVNLYDTTPTAPSVPCLVIQPGEPFVIFHDDDMDEWRARVLILAGLTSSGDAQDRIDNLVPIVKRAIEADQPDLDDLCYPDVERGAGYGEYPIGKAVYLGARIEVVFKVDPRAMEAE